MDFLYIQYYSKFLFYSILTFFYWIYLETNNYSMKFTLKIFLSLFLLFAISIQQCCDANQFHVTGSAQIKIRPNYAKLQIGAQAFDKTTIGALSLLNSKISHLINILRFQRILPGDYSTSSLTLSQVYQYRNGQRILVRQRASQTLKVKIRNLNEDGSQIGKLIDLASRVDGVTISGVTFDHSDKQQANRNARRAAFSAAEKKAKQYSFLSGLSIRKVKRIKSVEPQRVIPFFTNGKSFEGDFKTIVPVRDVKISAFVEVWFSLQP